MRRRSIHLLLLLASLGAASVHAAACTGGGSGHSIAPCCAAQGSVQSQGAAPAFAAPASTPTLYAQPFVVDTQKCTRLADIGSPDGVLTSVSAGKAVTIGADLTYSLKIDSTAEGKNVEIVVFQKSGTPKVRGIGLIGAVVEPQTGGAPIIVAPIVLSDSVDPTKVGEGTLEAAALCDLVAQNKMGVMVPADVRAVVTSEITASFTVSTGANALLNRLAEYNDALVGLSAFASSAQSAAFAQMRTDVETNLDACAQGVEQGGCSPGLDSQQRDLSRAGLYLDQASTYGLDPLTVFPNMPWPVAMTMFAQHVDDQVGDVPAPESSEPTRLSMRRLDYMLRYQAATFSLGNAVASPFTNSQGTTQFLDGAATPNPTPTFGTPESIQDGRIAVITAVLTTDTIATWQQSWTNWGQMGAFDFDQQIYPAATYFENVQGTGSGLQSEAQGSFLTPSSTFSDEVSFLYSTATSSGLFDSIRKNVAQQPVMGVAPAEEQLRISDLAWIWSVNGGTIPNGGPKNTP